MAATLTGVSRVERIRAALLAIVLIVAGCSGNAAASFDPNGPCTTDGSAAGAYPDLEARVPTELPGRQARQAGFRSALHGGGARLARRRRLQ